MKTLDAPPLRVLGYLVVTGDEHLLPDGEQLRTTRFGSGAERSARLFS
jgi:hypothetical protein